MTRRVARVSAQTLAALLSGAATLEDAGALEPEWQDLARTLSQCNGALDRLAAFEAFVQTQPDGAQIRADILGDEADADAGQLTLAWAGGIAERPVEWLWRGRLPAGHLTVLSSDPGRGKSTLLATIAATISKGGAWPDGGRATMGKVLLFCAEDDADTTIRPRLRAAGANLDNIAIATSFPAFPEEIATLEATVRRHAFVLCAFDPLDAYISGKLDTHRTASTRQALTPLTDLGRRTGCGLLGIMHLTKAATDRALYRVNSGIAFTAAARSVLGVGLDPDDEQRYLLARIKGNLSVEPAVLGYRLASFDTGLRDTFGAPHTVPVVSWAGEQVGLRAEEIFTADLDRKKQSKGTKAIDDWLTEALSDGAHPSVDLFAEAHDQGWSKKQVYAAGDRLGVQRRKSTFEGGWLWELPR